MTRNMENRVEILFPILKDHLKDRIYTWIDLMLQDNIKAREQDEYGNYHYIERQTDREPINSQELLCQMAYNAKKIKKIQSETMNEWKHKLVKLKIAPLGNLKKLML
jgi:polyphosphate kinase